MLVFFSSSRAHIFPLSSFSLLIRLKYLFSIPDIYSQIKTVPHVKSSFRTDSDNGFPPNAYFFPIDTPCLEFIFKDLAKTFSSWSRSTSISPFTSTPPRTPVAVHFPDPAIQPEIDPCSNSPLLIRLWDSVYPWGKRTCDSGRREFKNERREDWRRRG